jgi:hypothetical protein
VKRLEVFVQRFPQRATRREIDRHRTSVGLQISSIAVS